MVVNLGLLPQGAAYLIFLESFWEVDFLMHEGIKKSFCFGM